MSDVTGTVFPETESPGSARPALTAADRCDRCGAQAFVRIVLAGGGELLFCRHHYTEHEDKLRSIAIAVDDAREQLDTLTPER